jgi:hypothetical protein
VDFFSSNLDSLSILPPHTLQKEKKLLEQWGEHREKETHPLYGYKLCQYILWLTELKNSKRYSNLKPKILSILNNEKLKQTK